MSDYDNLLIKYQELENSYNSKVQEFEQYRGRFSFVIIQ